MASKTRTDALLSDLEQSLVRRNVQAGFELLDSSLGKTGRIDHRDRNAVSLLLCLAQWTDLGYRDLAFLDSFLAKFAAADPARMPVLDFLKWTLVQGYRSLAGEDVERAISCMDIALRAGDGVMPWNLVFLAHFWKGRAHRKKGEYELALLHICAAQKCAREADAPRLVAVTKIHESWLVFQKGERRQAMRLLDEAEIELKSTGHSLSLGNIESARGRFVRRSGEYAKALAHFEKSIKIYSRTHANHPNLARAMVNAAYVKRLIALDSQPQSRGGQARGAAHARYLQTTREALDLLQRAGEIYAMHHHQGGTGSVLVNSGHLHLESGDIDQAATEAIRAYTLGNEKGDQILMARAMVLQAAVELARSEEQLGDDPDASHHAVLAVQYADRAIEIARHTQNKRLLAEAYIARGLAAADDLFQEWDVAKEYAAKAADLLSADDRDHLFRELSALKQKILRSTGIDQTLRLWSDGELGNKTFQQVQEEFAELVIPKIWLNMGKNVTRVSQKLSISPKKVRRILRNARYVQSSSPPPEA